MKQFLLSRLKEEPGDADVEASIDILAEIQPSESQSEQPYTSLIRQTSSRAARKADLGSTSLALAFGAMF